MTAAAYSFSTHQDHSNVPTELEAIFEQSAKVRASFLRLPEPDRQGFVRFIEDGPKGLSRAHRARIIGKSLFGLAADIHEDTRLL